MPSLVSLWSSFICSPMLPELLHMFSGCPFSGKLTQCHFRVAYLSGVLEKRLGGWLGTLLSSGRCTNPLSFEELGVHLVGLTEAASEVY